MHVSVIIPTFNRSASLKRTLDSISGLTPLPHEVIVVDQSDAFDHRLSTRPSTFPCPLRLAFVRPPNAQVARNLAAGMAEGDVLLFLDDDVIVEPDLIAAHTRNFELDGTIGAVGGFFLEPGESPTEDLPDACRRPHTGWIHFPHRYSKRYESGLFPSCNGSIRRDVLFRVGGFDENFIRTHLDDTDLSARLRAHGVRIVHDPEARLLHLKEPMGGARPAAIDHDVLADRFAWQVWCYFYWSNFGIFGFPELWLKLRGCVLRRANVSKPSRIAVGMLALGRGAIAAAVAMRRGRRLPLRMAAP